MKKIVIAIDGFSSTGKSTLAKKLAQKLNYTYVDSGAMYRAITLYVVEHNLPIENESLIKLSLSSIHLNFDKNQICLNGENVESKIRSLAISGKVSEVSALECVREVAVAQQQKMGIEKGIVMDGRDIGTTVFPSAELKIYMTADVTIRAQRRYDELKAKDPNQDFESVAQNLAHRDLIDSTREISPLRKADDAVVLDNSHLNLEQSIDLAYAWALEKMNQ